jgi:hypothetical protein
MVPEGSVPPAGGAETIVVEGVKDILGCVGREILKPGQQHSGQEKLIFSSQAI